MPSGGKIELSDISNSDYQFAIGNPFFVIPTKPTTTIMSTLETTEFKETRAHTPDVVLPCRFQRKDISKRAKRKLEAEYHNDYVKLQKLKQRVKDKTAALKANIEHGTEAELLRIKDDASVFVDKLWSGEQRVIAYNHDIVFVSTKIRPKPDDLEGAIIADGKLMCREFDTNTQCVVDASVSCVYIRRSMQGSIANYRTWARVDRFPRIELHVDHSEHTGPYADEAFNPLLFPRELTKCVKIIREAVYNLKRRDNPIHPILDKHLLRKILEFLYDVDLLVICRGEQRYIDPPTRT